MMKYDILSHRSLSSVENTANISIVKTPTGSGVYLRNGRSFSPFLKECLSTNEPTIGSFTPSQTFITISITDTAIAGNAAISVRKY